MEFLADRIAGCFIHNGVVEEENRDICVFGLIHVFSHSIGIAVAMVVGVSFAIPFEMLVFFVPLTVLRISAGGYHADTFWRCIAVSILVILAVAVIILIKPSVYYITAIFVILPLSIIIIFMLAPVINDNHPLTPDSISRFRKRSRLLVVGAALLIGLVALLGGKYYAFCATLGVGVATISIPAALIKNFRRQRK